MRSTSSVILIRSFLPGEDDKVSLPSGGNQRELARQKNMKKTQEISKGKRKEDCLTASQRKQRDSEIMQQKQKIANEKKSMQTREK
ncbi:small EDRK-rich factor 1 isoform X1 [Alexandromys fortis]|uniref:small EDRK-rich factor 1 isoform X1 n=1 Tax=Alexandromys fortis TaxID=100897 RepID=UPI0021536299|nr:small EDRK-rich factor 1 isoform X1 [Microtus fortis]